MKKQLVQYFVREKLASWRRNLLQRLALPVYAVATLPNRGHPEYLLLAPHDEEMTLETLLQVQEVVTQMIRATLRRDGPCPVQADFHSLLLNRPCDELWPGVPPELIVAAGPTPALVTLDGVLCRPWMCHTGRGEKVTLYVHLLRCEEGTRFQETAERYFVETPPPTDLDNGARGG